MRMLLAKYGLEPARDVAFVQIGGMPEIAAALSKKIIAAAMMSHPMAYVAEQGGAKVLANLAKEEIPFMHMGFTTTRKFVKERRGQVKAMIRAYGRAVHFMHTRKSKPALSTSATRKLRTRACSTAASSMVSISSKRCRLLRPRRFR